MSTEATPGFATRAIHAGQPPDEATGAVVVPIYQTSTFAQAAVGKHRGYEYSRTGNPTRAALEQCIAALEGGKHGLAFGSGMAAEATIMQVLKPGDHTVAVDDLYGGTYRLFRRVLEPMGLSFSFVDGSDLKAVEKAVTERTRLVWLESPTNPLLKLVDIQAVSALAHARQAVVVVDNTFMSPYFQRPLSLGADIVVHSATKYLGGHSDLIGGTLVVNREDLFEQLAFLQNAIGGIPGPMDAWLVLRGLKTLAIRMREHDRNARHVAAFLVEPSAARARRASDVRFRRHDLLRGQGRISLRSAGRRADPAVHPGGEPGRRRVPDRASGRHDACLDPGRNPPRPRRG